MHFTYIGWLIVVATDVEFCARYWVDSAWLKAFSHHFSFVFILVSSTNRGSDTVLVKPSIDLHVMFGLILVPCRASFLPSSDALSLLSFRILNDEIDQLTSSRPRGVRRGRVFSEHCIQDRCSRPRRFAFSKISLNVAGSSFPIRLCWLQEVPIGRCGNNVRVSAEPPVGSRHMSSNDWVLRSL